VPALFNANEQAVLKQRLARWRTIAGLLQQVGGSRAYHMSCLPTLPLRILSHLVHIVANRDRDSQFVCERFWGHLVGIEEAALVLRALKE